MDATISYGIDCTFIVHGLHEIIMLMSESNSYRRIWLLLLSNVLMYINNNLVISFVVVVFYF